jgi:RND family efflux transporter MFP subunit
MIGSWRSLLVLAMALGTASAEGARAQDAPPAVTVARPLLETIVEWDEFTGRFESSAAVDVRSRVSGYLQSIHFTDGQIVTKDQLLFVVDPRPFEAALDRARAELESARATAELARLDLERARQLVNTSAVARATFDQRQQEKASADAAVGVAEAALRHAALDLEFTRIKSPIEGRISNRRVDVGNLVTGGDSATLLTTIVALDPIYFVFDMSETEFSAYQAAAREGRMVDYRAGGADVHLRLPSQQDWPYAGRVDFVDNVVDAATGTLRARAVLTNPDLMLTPGQFGRLRLAGSVPYEAVLVPDQAILSDQARKVVLTVDGEGTVQPRVVRTGPLHLGLRIIREGLDGGETIVTDGLLRARPGGKVTPQPGTIAFPKTTASAE